MDHLKKNWLKYVIGLVVVIVLVFWYRSCGGTPTGGATSSEPSPTASPAQLPSPVTTPTPAASPSPVAALTPEEKKVVVSALDELLKEKGRDISALSGFLADSVFKDRISAEIHSLKAEDFDKLARVKEQEIEGLRKLNAETAEAYRNLLALAMQMRRGLRDEEIKDSAFPPRRPATDGGRNPCAVLTPRKHRLCEEARRAQQYYQ